MMGYNGPRHHSYYRRSRGPRFPWMLLPFLFIFFGGGHIWWLLPVGLIVMFLFIAIQRMAWSAASTRNQQTNYTPPQTPYYQPSVQENDQPYYEPYQQGYQAPAQNSTPEYYTPYTPESQQEDPYQAYDQPKAEYPQQMPPM